MTNALRRALCLGMTACLAMLAQPSQAVAELGVLESVRTGGHLICGVGDGPAGYSTVNGQGVWTGISVDFCRALAAAVLGSKDAVKFRLLAAGERFSALQAREIDVL